MCKGSDGVLRAVVVKGGKPTKLESAYKPVARWSVAPFVRRTPRRLQWESRASR
jgi:hypothetical protein